MSNVASQPEIIQLSKDQVVGHADHWASLTSNIPETVPNWLQKHIDTATLPTPLSMPQKANTTDNNIGFGKNTILLSGNEAVHINQVIGVDGEGKPKTFLNAYPSVNSPYGVWASVENVLCCEHCHDAILRLKCDDGTVIYAFDQLYAINKNAYQKNQRYYVNLSALAYNVAPSNKTEIIKVEDPESIRYHRAFNDILTANNGNPPADLQQQIADWQPDPSILPLEPIEINVGHMCAYLFGDTVGQQDEAWVQGQILGKQLTTFNDVALTLLDVVILRESLDSPVVIRLATQTLGLPKLEVGDYIQANIWLQAAIYQENQYPKKA